MRRRRVAKCAIVNGGRRMHHWGILADSGGEAAAVWPPLHISQPCEHFCYALRFPALHLSRLCLLMLSARSSAFSERESASARYLGCVLLESLLLLCAFSLRAAFVQRQLLHLARNNWLQVNGPGSSPAAKCLAAVKCFW